jgi:hypothetical protein
MVFFFLPNVGVPVADAPGCTVACRLILQPEVLDVTTCTTRCPARHNDASEPNSERWNYWARNGRYGVVGRTVAAGSIEQYVYYHIPIRSCSF